ncbi:MAG: cation:proton antiporter [Rikenellaceae bacterium]
MLHLNPIFLNLALILVVAAVTTLIFKYLKQPPVLGYVVAGFLTGPNFILLPEFLDQKTITTWGEIGVVFLLFALGLEFSFKKLRKVGGPGALTAVTEAIIMMGLGMAAGLLMGWSFINSLFLGGMISISSTSIIIKAFEDMKLNNKKFAHIVIGVLVVEDLVAILLLVLLSTIAISRDFGGVELLVEMSKLILFLILTFTAGVYFIPSLLRKIRNALNDETLLIVSLGLCLGLVVLASYFGFSPALGAFLMGSILSETDDSARIQRLVLPLRNLFAAIFFISVGMSVDPDIIVSSWGYILIISTLVIFFKPLSATFGILLSGQTLYTSLKSGLCLSQIGEFSFIIASLGLSLGVLKEEVYPIIVAVSIISVFTTPYIIKNSDNIYKWIYSKARPSWRVVIDRYGSGSRILNREKEWKGVVRGVLLNIAIYSGWMIAMLFICIKILAPLVKEQFGYSLTIKIVLSIISIIAISPFLYALMTKGTRNGDFERLWSDNKYSRGPLLTVRLSRYVIGGMFVGFAMGSFLSIKLFILIPAIIVILSLTLLSSSLRKYYKNIETQFLVNLDKTKYISGIAIPKRLSMDIHLEILELPPNSSIVGMTISEVHHKYKTGAQIVCIYRRGTRINLPDKTSMLYATDKLLVIGTDDQILRFVSSIEIPFASQDNETIEHEIDLYQITLTKESPLIGVRSHISELRNNFNFLFIGYEKPSHGFMRPKPDYYFVEGDTLWIVGEKEVVKKLS